jgi:hypothetical protein
MNMFAKSYKYYHIIKVALIAIILDAMPQSASHEAKYRQERF